MHPVEFSHFAPIGNRIHRDVEQSAVLSGVDGASLAGFITEREALTRMDWLQKVRDWARGQGDPGAGR